MAISTLLVALGLGLSGQTVDVRAHYDAEIYRLDLRVDPVAQNISGTMAMAAKVTADSLSTIELDLEQKNTVFGANLVDKPLTPNSPLSGAKLAVTHSNERIRIRLPRAYKKGEQVRVAVQYQAVGQPRANWEGLMFVKTPDGQPWIATSTQTPGSQTWFPSKSEAYHPNDPLSHLFVNLSVPVGLTGVSNGRLTGRTRLGGWETFHWRHDYPVLNYSVSLNVAPYVEVKSTIQVPGLSEPTPWVYYVLPQDLEKAKVQFAMVPEMIRVFSEAFGPFPFPKSKICLVQVPYWGMEHSTAVAYGSSFPAWLKQNGGSDPYAGPNRYYDYIVVHEMAHEWWANAISAADWGHLWLHEGFGTYAEAVYLERTENRAKADQFLDDIKRQIGKKFRMYRGKGTTPRQAFNNNVYYKGAWVLNTLRTYIDNDEAFFRSLKEFNVNHRHKPSTTEDFRAVVERVTGKNWKQFFDEWFYGDGQPTLQGSVTPTEGKLIVQIESGGTADGRFHVPLDVTWREGDVVRKERVMLKPGANRLEIPTSGLATSVETPTLRHILVDTDVKLAPATPESRMAA